MLPLRCLALFSVVCIVVPGALAQEERKVLLFAAASDEKNNLDLQGKEVASLVVDKEDRAKVEFSKTVKVDGESPRAGTYYRLNVLFTIGKKTRSSDLYFSEDLPRGTRVTAARATGKFQAFLSNIGGKTLVRPRRVDLVLYEATVVLPRPK